MPDQRCTVYGTLYPARNFPTARSWTVQPPTVSVTPPPLHLHLWHYLGNTAAYVPMQRPGTGEMMYWFHHGTYLPERARWLAFVRQQLASCYVIDLPTVAAAKDLHGCHRWFVLRYSAEVHRFLAGYTGHAPTPSPMHILSWWCPWHFYLQSCGHMVHSHYTDMRLRMSPG